MKAQLLTFESALRAEKNLNSETKQHLHFLLRDIEAGMTRQDQEIAKLKTTIDEIRKKLGN